MSGVIERIRVYPAKGEPGIDAAQARLVENSGLEGDFHASGGGRQISLLFAEARGVMTGAQEKGLCFSRFKENISVGGLGPDELKPGTRFKAGNAVVEITEEGKHCHEECTLYRTGKKCPLAGLSLFARVLKSGVIRNGDGFVRLA